PIQDDTRAVDLKPRQNATFGDVVAERSELLRTHLRYPARINVWRQRRRVGCPGLLRTWRFPCKWSSHIPERANQTNEPDALFPAGTSASAQWHAVLSPSIQETNSRLPGGDQLLRVRPLPLIDGYAFPEQLTASLTSTSPTVWFTLHLELEFTH